MLLCIHSLVHSLFQLMFTEHLLCTKYTGRYLLCRSEYKTWRLSSENSPYSGATGKCTFSLQCNNYYERVCPEYYEKTDLRVVHEEKK